MENNTKAPEAPKEAAPGKAASEPAKQMASKSNNNKVVIIIVAVIAALVVFGMIGSIIMGKLFKKGAENLVEKASNSQITTNKDGTTTIKSNDGSAAYSTEQKLPDDFPKDIPLYSGQKITGSSKVKTDNETTWQVTAETSDSVSKTTDGVKKLYSGWEQSSESQANDTYYYYFTKGNFTANVYVASGDKTTISYTVTQKTSTE